LERTKTGGAFELVSRFRDKEAPGKEWLTIDKDSPLLIGRLESVREL
jgi:hypothetical protein